MVKRYSQTQSRLCNILSFLITKSRWPKIVDPDPNWNLCRTTLLILYSKMSKRYGRNHNTGLPTQSKYILHIQTWSTNNSDDTSLRLKSIFLISGNVPNRDIPIRLTQEYLHREQQWKTTSYTRKQCCGSMTFWCGSGSADPRLWLMDPGSGSCYFRHWPSRCQQKTK
jgi:hypothetical protein